MKDKILKYISLFFFILFFANILIGKFNNMYDMDIYHLGDVAEFLLLLISSTSIIIVAIDLENKDENDVNSETEANAS